MRDQNEAHFSFLVRNVVTQASTLGQAAADQNLHDITILKQR